MTAEEFEAMYCERSGRTIEDFRKYKAVRPCDCGADNCHGWQALPHEFAEEYDREHQLAEGIIQATRLDADDTADQVLDKIKMIRNFIE